MYAFVGIRFIANAIQHLYVEWIVSKVKGIQKMKVDKFESIPNSEENVVILETKLKKTTLTFLESRVT